MKKTILFTVLCAFLSFNLFCQENDQVELRKHEFGMHAGATTGVGLSYRFWPGKLGVQITLMPIKTDDITWISTGLSGLLTMYDSKYFRFFGYLGSHMIIVDEEHDNFWDNDDDSDNDEEQQFNIGFGPGFGFGTRARFNIMVGYGLYDITGKFNMYPTAEMGLYFRF